MKVRLWSIAIAAIIASSASWAGPLSVVTNATQQAERSKTRAEVLQELEQARNQGLLHFADHEYPVIRTNGHRKTRAEVVHELEQARKQGLLDFADDEYPVTRIEGNSKTRSEVLQELEQARKQGLLDIVDP
ncbi:DUF4148 domain-containing protein [Paenalcaligenes niemegkensis]|uniref:DUF4148 domain-containing protein n=1 Tax=Paenalcaligenes niemegkensis TaxID=2895469 RepID=UPI001EE93439|nr:DUF4148 domain-containing protein [Paenalcaligenes niemegkensis]MCQ9617942.1 DUF4148 domain-containing protein [Paenalcaligenes niemegkensis]